MKFYSFFVALILAAQSIGHAELAVPGFFSDHMVLQQQRDAAVWGQASPGKEVQVRFRGKITKTEADSHGHWRVDIPTGRADAEGSSLTISCGDDLKQIDDVLVGEVWFASGQSNMVFTMGRVPAYADIVAESDFPGIRMFNAPTVTAVEPQSDIGGEWTLCGPKTVPNYSAVAFFFARKLHQELGVPVGIIKSAWGGKPVETFTSREALESLDETKKLVEALLESDAQYDADKARIAYQSRLDQWNKAAEERRNKPVAQRGRLPRRPAAPKRPLDTEGNPGVLFNSMIHPFVGYSIRGAIWYQGEANAKPGRVPYDQTLDLMIRDWRERWGDEFSFYFVQLANFRDPSDEPGTPDPWALLQDRMRLVLQTTPKTGMAIINDVGEAKDIHPKNKLDPGERLARWALAKDYGKDVVVSGPLYRSSEIDGGEIRVEFDHVGAGLKSRDGEPLRRFEIAGKDRQWVWADAKIDGKDVVVVSSADVGQPVAVRYAWASNPEGANLVNSDALPASIFRTDAWKDAEIFAVDPLTERQTERRAIQTRIKTLNARRQSMQRSSDEYKALTQRRDALLKRFKELAPNN